MIIFFCFFLRNTLIRINGLEAVITDFGLSQFVKNKRRTEIISPRWASPELVKTKIPNRLNDVWALG